MDKSPSKTLPDGQQDDPGSFKDQMAARYKERQSMGFHLKHVAGNEGPGRDDTEQSEVSLASEKKGSALQGYRFSTESLPNPKLRDSVTGQAPPLRETQSTAIDTRRSMKELITQFEKKCHTALDPTNDQGEKTLLNVTAETENSRLAREAWRGSKRTPHIDLDEMANTSSSSSLSLSDISAEIDLDSLQSAGALGEGAARRLRRRQTRRRGKRYGELRSASSFNLDAGCLELSASNSKAEGEKGSCAFSGLRGLSNAVDTDTEKDVPLTADVSLNGSGVDKARDQQTTASVQPQIVKVTESGTMHKGEAHVDLNPSAQVQEATSAEKSPLVCYEPDNQENQLSKLAEGEDRLPFETDQQVPQPLRISLKEFATRKKRSTNPGQVKYQVHRKDWNKYMQTRPGFGHQNKPMTTVTDSMLNRHSMQEVHRQPQNYYLQLQKSQLSQQQQQEKDKKSPQEKQQQQQQHQKQQFQNKTKRHGFEYNFLSTAQTSSSPNIAPQRGTNVQTASNKSKNVFKSPSNTQQRLERRLSQRNLASHPPSSVVHKPKTTPVVRRSVGAMDRCLTFLNRNVKRNNLKGVSTGTSPIDGILKRATSDIIGRAEVETDTPETKLLKNPSASVPPTPSPCRRKELADQPLQVLIKEAMESKQRPRTGQANFHKTGTTYLKQDTSGIPTRSTGSLQSNPNSCSTIELEDLTDRALAQLEEVTASKLHRSCAHDVGFQNIAAGNKATGAKVRDNILPSVSDVDKPEKDYMVEIVGIKDLVSCLPHGSQNKVELIDVPRGTSASNVRPKFSSRSVSPWLRTMQRANQAMENRSRSSPATASNTPPLAGICSPRESNTPDLSQRRLARLDLGMIHRRNSTGQISQDSERSGISASPVRRYVPKRSTPTSMKQAPNFPFTSTRQNLRSSTANGERTKLEQLEASVTNGSLFSTDRGLPGNDSALMTQDVTLTSLGNSQTTTADIISLLHPQVSTLATRISSPPTDKTDLSNLATSLLSLNPVDMAGLLNTKWQLSRQAEKKSPEPLSRITSLPRPAPRRSVYSDGTSLTGHKGTLRVTEAPHHRSNAGETKHVGQSFSTHTGTTWPPKYSLGVDSRPWRNNSPLYKQNDTEGKPGNHSGHPPTLRQSYQQLYQPKRRRLTNFESEELTALQETVRQLTQAIAKPSTLSPTNISTGNVDQPQNNISPSIKRQSGLTPANESQPQRGTTQHPRGATPKALGTVPLSTSFHSKERWRKGATHGGATTEDRRTRRLLSREADTNPTRKTAASTSRIEQSRGKNTKTASSNVAVTSSRRYGASLKSASTNDVPTSLAHSFIKTTEEITTAVERQDQMLPAEDSFEKVEESMVQIPDSKEARGDTPATGGTDSHSEQDAQVTCHFGSVEDKEVEEEKDEIKSTSSLDVSLTKTKRKVGGAGKKFKKRKRRRGEVVGSTVKEGNELSPEGGITEKTSKGDKVKDKPTKDTNKRDKSARLSGLAVGPDERHNDVFPTGKVMHRKATAHSVSPKMAVTKSSSQGSMISKDESPSPVGITSVTIRKISPTRSSFRTKHQHGDIKYRPVKRLTRSLIPGYPTYSRLPLRVNGPIFYQTRNKTDLFAQYRRLRENMADPTQPSKLPISDAFRWTLDSAVVQEWALHGWSPDSGIYVDAQGALWSPVNQTIPTSALCNFPLHDIFIGSANLSTRRNIITDMITGPKIERKHPERDVGQTRKTDLHVHTYPCSELMEAEKLDVVYASTCHQLASLILTRWVKDKLPEHVRNNLKYFEVFVDKLNLHYVFRNVGYRRHSSSEICSSEGEGMKSDTQMSSEYFFMWQIVDGTHKIVYHGMGDARYLGLFLFCVSLKSVVIMKRVQQLILIFVTELILRVYFLFMQTVKFDYQGIMGKMPDPEELYDLNRNNNGSHASPTRRSATEKMESLQSSNHRYPLRREKFKIHTEKSMRCMKAIKNRRTSHPMHLNPFGLSTKQSDPHLVLSIFSLLEILGSDTPESDKSSEASFQVKSSRDDFQGERNNNSRPRPSNVVEDFSVSISSYTRTGLGREGTTDQGTSGCHLGKKVADTNWVEFLKSRRVKRDSRPRPWREPAAVNDNSSVRSVASGVSPKKTRTGSECRGENGKPYIQSGIQRGHKGACRNYVANKLDDRFIADYRKQSTQQSCQKISPRARSREDRRAACGNKRNVASPTKDATGEQGPRNIFKVNANQATGFTTASQRLQTDPYSHVKAKVESRMRPGRFKSRNKKMPKSLVLNQFKGNSLDEACDWAKRLGSRLAWDANARHIQTEITRKVEEVVMKKAKAIVKSYQDFLEREAKQYCSGYLQENGQSSELIAGCNAHENGHTDNTAGDKTCLYVNKTLDDTTLEFSDESERAEKLRIENSIDYKIGDLDTIHGQKPPALAEGRDFADRSVDMCWYHRPGQKSMQLFSPSISTMVDNPTVISIERGAASTRLENSGTEITTTTRGEMENILIPAREMYVTKSQEHRGFVCPSSGIRPAFNTGPAIKLKPSRIPIPIRRERLQNTKKTTVNIQQATVEAQHHFTERGNVTFQRSPRNTRRLESVEDISPFVTKSIQSTRTHPYKTESCYNGQMLTRQSVRPKPVWEVPMDAPWWRRSASSDSFTWRRNPVTLNISPNRNVSSEASISSCHLAESESEKGRQILYKHGISDGVEAFNTPTRATRKEEQFFSPIVDNDATFQTTTKAVSQDVEEAETAGRYLYKFLLSGWRQLASTTNDRAQHEDVDQQRKKAEPKFGYSIFSHERLSSSSSWYSDAHRKADESVNGANKAPRSPRKSAYIETKERTGCFVNESDYKGANRSNDMNELSLRDVQQTSGKESRKGGSSADNYTESAPYTSSLSTMRSISDLPFNDSSCSGQELPIESTECASGTIDPHPVFSPHKQVICSLPKETVHKSSYREKLSAFQKQELCNITVPDKPQKRTCRRISPKFLSANTGCLMKNVNFSNKGCRTSISEPNLSSESERRPAKRPLPRRCYSSLAVNCSSSSYNLQAIPSAGTCYFSDLPKNVRRRMNIKKIKPTGCPFQQNHKLRNVFVKLAGGDGWFAQTKKSFSASPSTSTEFWSDFEVRPTRHVVVNTCQSNSPVITKSRRSNAAKHLQPKCRSKTHMPNETSYISPRQRATPRRRMLKTLNKPVHSDGSPVSVQSFPSLLKFWEARSCLYKGPKFSKNYDRSYSNISSSPSTVRCRKKNFVRRSSWNRGNRDISQLQRKGRGQTTRANYSNMCRHRPSHNLLVKQRQWLVNSKILDKNYLEKFNNRNGQRNRSSRVPTFFIGEMLNRKDKELKKKRLADIKNLKDSEKISRTPHSRCDHADDATDYFSPKTEILLSKNFNKVPQEAQSRKPTSVQNSSHPAACVQHEERNLSDTKEQRYSGTSLFYSVESTDLPKAILNAKALDGLKSTLLLDQSQSIEMFRRQRVFEFVNDTYHNHGLTTGALDSDKSFKGLGGEKHHNSTKLINGQNLTATTTHFQNYGELHDKKSCENHLGNHVALKNVDREKMVKEAQVEKLPVQENFIMKKGIKFRPQHTAITVGNYSVKRRIISRRYEPHLRVGDSPSKAGVLDQRNKAETFENFGRFEKLRLPVRNDLTDAGEGSSPTADVDKMSSCIVLQPCLHSSGYTMPRCHKQESNDACGISGQDGSTTISSPGSDASLHASSSQESQLIKSDSVTSTATGYVISTGLDCTSESSTSTTPTNTTLQHFEDKEEKQRHCRSTASDLSSTEHTSQGRRRKRRNSISTHVKTPRLTFLLGSGLKNKDKRYFKKDRPLLYGTKTVTTGRTRIWDILNSRSPRVLHYNSSLATRRGCGRYERDHRRSASEDSIKSKQFSSVATPANSTATSPASTTNTYTCTVNTPFLDGSEDFGDGLSKATLLSGQNVCKSPDESPQSVHSNATYLVSTPAVRHQTHPLSRSSSSLDRFEDSDRATTNVSRHNHYSCTTTSTNSGTDTLHNIGSVPRFDRHQVQHRRGTEPVAAQNTNPRTLKSVAFETNKMCSPHPIRARGEVKERSPKKGPEPVLTARQYEREKTMTQTSNTNDLYALEREETNLNPRLERINCEGYGPVPIHQFRLPKQAETSYYTSQHLRKNFISNRRAGEESLLGPTQQVFSSKDENLYKCICTPVRGEPDFNPVTGEIINEHGCSEPVQTIRHEQNDFCKISDVYAHDENWPELVYRPEQKEFHKSKSESDVSYDSHSLDRCRRVELHLATQRRIFDTKWKAKVEALKLMTEKKNLTEEKKDITSPSSKSLQPELPLSSTEKKDITAEKRNKMLLVESLRKTQACCEIENSQSRLFPKTTFSDATLVKSTMGTGLNIMSTSPALMLPQAVLDNQQTPKLNLAKADEGQTNKRSTEQETELIKDTTSPIVNKGKVISAPRDIEIVLGDDVTVQEFIKCFMTGLDLQLNNSGLDSKQERTENIAESGGCGPDNRPAGSARKKRCDSRPTRRLGEKSPRTSIEDSAILKITDMNKTQSRSSQGKPKEKSTKQYQSSATTRKYQRRNGNVEPNTKVAVAGGRKGATVESLATDMMEGKLLNRSRESGDWEKKTKTESRSQFLRRLSSPKRLRRQVSTGPTVSEDDEPFTSVAWWDRSKHLHTSKGSGQDKTSPDRKRVVCLHKGRPSSGPACSTLASMSNASKRSEKKTETSVAGNETIYWSSPNTVKKEEKKKSSSVKRNKEGHNDEAITTRGTKKFNNRTGQMENKERSTTAKARKPDRQRGDFIPLDKMGPKVTKKGISNVSILSPLKLDWCCEVDEGTPHGENSPRVSSPHFDLCFKSRVKYVNHPPLNRDPRTSNKMWQSKLPLGDIQEGLLAPSVNRKRESNERRNKQIKTSYVAIPTRISLLQSLEDCEKAVKTKHRSLRVTQRKSASDTSIQSNCINLLNPDLKMNHPILGDRHVKTQGKLKKTTMDHPPTSLLKKAKSCSKNVADDARDTHHFGIYNKRDCEIKEKQGTNTRRDFKSPNAKDKKYMTRTKLEEHDDHIGQIHSPKYLHSVNFNFNPRPKDYCRDLEYIDLLLGKKKSNAKQEDDLNKYLKKYGETLFVEGNNYDAVSEQSPRETCIYTYNESHVQSENVKVPNGRMALSTYPTLLHTAKTSTGRQGTNKTYQENITRWETTKSPPHHRRDKLLRDAHLPDRGQYDISGINRDERHRAKYGDAATIMRRSISGGDMLQPNTNKYLEATKMQPQFEGLKRARNVQVHSERYGAGQGSVMSTDYAISLSRFDRFQKHGEKGLGDDMPAMKPAKDSMLYRDFIPQALQDDISETRHSCDARPQRLAQNQRGDRGHHYHLTERNVTLDARLCYNKTTEPETTTTTSETVEHRVGLVSTPAVESTFYSSVNQSSREALKDVERTVGNLRRGNLPKRGNHPNCDWHLPSSPVIYTQQFSEESSRTPDPPHRPTQGCVYTQQFSEESSRTPDPPHRPTQGCIQQKSAERPVPKPRTTIGGYVGRMLVKDSAHTTKNIKEFSRSDVVAPETVRSKSNVEVGRHREQLECHEQRQPLVAEEALPHTPPECCEKTCDPNDEFDNLCHQESNVMDRSRTHKDLPTKVAQEESSDRSHHSGEKQPKARNKKSESSQDKCSPKTSAGLLNESSTFASVSPSSEIEAGSIDTGKTAKDSVNLKGNAAAERKQSKKRKKTKRLLLSNIDPEEKSKRDMHESMTNCDLKTSCNGDMKSLSIRDLTKVIEKTVRESIDSFIQQDNMQIQRRSAHTRNPRMYTERLEDPALYSPSDLERMGFSPPTVSLKSSSSKLENELSKKTHKAHKLPRKTCTDPKVDLSSEVWPERKNFSRSHQENISELDEIPRQDFSRDSKRTICVSEKTSPEKPKQATFHVESKKSSESVERTNARLSAPCDIPDTPIAADATPLKVSHRNADSTLRFFGPCSFVAEKVNAYLVPRKGVDGKHNVLLHLCRGSGEADTTVLVEPPASDICSTPRVISDNGYIHVEFKKGTEKYVEGEEVIRRPLSCETSAHTQTEDLPQTDRDAQTEPATVSPTATDCEVDKTQTKEQNTSPHSWGQERSAFVRYDKMKTEALVPTTFSTSQFCNRDHLLQMCTSFILEEMLGRRNTEQIQVSPNLPHNIDDQEPRSGRALTAEKQFAKVMNCSHRPEAYQQSGSQQLGSDPGMKVRRPKPIHQPQPSIHDRVLKKDDGLSSEHSLPPPGNINMEKNRECETQALRDDKRHTFSGVIADHRGVKSLRRGSVWRVPPVSCNDHGTNIPHRTTDQQERAHSKQRVRAQVAEIAEQRVVNHSDRVEASAKESKRDKGRRVMQRNNDINTAMQSSQALKEDNLRDLSTSQDSESSETWSTTTESEPKKIPHVERSSEPGAPPLSTRAGPSGEALQTEVSRSNNSTANPCQKQLSESSQDETSTSSGQLDSSDRTDPSGSEYSYETSETHSSKGSNRIAQNAGKWRPGNENTSKMKSCEITPKNSTPKLRGHVIRDRERKTREPRPVSSPEASVDRPISGERQLLDFRKMSRSKNVGQSERARGSIDYKMRAQRNSKADESSRSRTSCYKTRARTTGADEITDNTRSTDTSELCDEECSSESDEVSYKVPRQQQQQEVHQRRWKQQQQQQQQQQQRMHFNKQPEPQKLSKVLNKKTSKVTRQLDQRIRQSDREISSPDTSSASRKQFNRVRFSDQVTEYLTDRDNTRTRGQDVYQVPYRAAPDTFSVGWATAPSQVMTSRLNPPLELPHRPLQRQLIDPVAGSATLRHDQKTSNAFSGGGPRRDRSVAEFRLGSGERQDSGYNTPTTPTGAQRASSSDASLSAWDKAIQTKLNKRLERYTHT